MFLLFCFVVFFFIFAPLSTCAKDHWKDLESTVYAMKFHPFSGVYEYSPKKGETARYLFHKVYDKTGTYERKEFP